MSIKDLDCDFKSLSIARALSIIQDVNKILRWPYKWGSDPKSVCLLIKEATLKGNEEGFALISIDDYKTKSGKIEIIKIILDN